MWKDKRKGRQRSLRWYRFLLQVNFPFPHWRLGVCPPNLKSSSNCKNIFSEKYMDGDQRAVAYCEVSVLVSLGCYTKYCQLVISSTETLCSQFWRLGSPRSRYRLDSWWGPSLKFVDCCLLSVSLHGLSLCVLVERGNSLSSSPYKDPTLMISSKPDDFWKVLPPNIITLGLGLQHVNFGGGGVYSPRIFSP